MLSFDRNAVEASFAATAPRRGGQLGLYALAAAVAVLFIVLAVSGPRLGVHPVISVLFPWILLLALVAVGWAYSRRIRLFREKLAAAWDHMQLEEWSPAEGIVSTLIDRPVRSETDRGQIFLIWAGLAEHERRYDCAGHIYDTLVEDRIGDAVQLHNANLLRAANKLRTGELTDAVSLIGRLERIPVPDYFRAGCDLIRLFQQVLMGHFEDAVREMPARRARFREHLSTRAAYAYALFAAALHGLRRTEEAADCWRDATTLMPPDRLLREFDFLAPMAGQYPATEQPL